jgi:O-antigen/teichoic acid export membrane protein
VSATSSDTGVRAPAADAPEPGAGIAARMVSATMVSLLGQALPLCAALVATPFVLRLIGPGQYGVLSLVTSTLTYFVLAAGLGMGVASTRFATDALARGDDAEEAAVVWTTLVIALVAAAVVGIALTLAAGPLTHALHVAVRLRPRAVDCFRLAAVVGVLRIATNILNTPQLARLRWSTYTFVDSGTNLLQVVLTPLALLMWRNVIAALIVLVAMTALDCCGQLAFSARLQPAVLSPCVRRSLVRPILGFGSGMLGSALANLPLTNVGQFLLAGIQSTRAVAYYAVALTIV